MSDTGRYVLLGLAHPRAAWFSELAHWATAGIAPLEFIKCVSLEEVIARLESERPFSALLVDAETIGVDRDLIDLARRRHCAVIAVGDPPRDWPALGVTNSVGADLDRGVLVATLAENAALVGHREARPAGPPSAPITPWRGRLIAVTGTGGTGASTVAMALAQGLGDDVRHAGMVLLADLALDADLAMYHDTGTLVPGLPELVEAHRHTTLRTGSTRDLTFEIVARRYRLLLGLRQHRDWTALAPRALEAGLDSLRTAFHITVADVDADLEGERDTGAADLDDRNVAARTAVDQADLVVLVGLGDLKGLFALQRLARRVRNFGVPGVRVLPVLNRAPRSTRARAAFSRDFADVAGELGTSAPVPLPERRNLDDVHRNGGRLPHALSEPLVGAVNAMLDRVPPLQAEPAEPQAIVPGSLGTWTDQEAAS